MHTVTVLKCLKCDTGAIVMRVLATNAVLRFSPTDSCLAGVVVGSHATVDAFRYDNGRKVVTCRSAIKTSQDDCDVNRDSKRVCL